MQYFIESLFALLAVVHVEKFVGVMFTHLIEHLHHNGVLLGALEHGAVVDVVETVTALFLRLADGAG